MASPRIAAVFDLDKTIISTTLFNLFISAYVRRKDFPWTAFLYMPILLLLSVALRNKKFIRNGIIMMLYKKNKIELSTYWNRFLQDLPHDIYIHAVDEKINEHKRLGHFIIILTNNIDFIAEQIVKKYNVDALKATETTTDQNHTIINPRPFLSEIKMDKRSTLVELSKKMKIDLNASFGYGDSPEDYEFLKIVGNPYLVIGKEKIVPFVNEDA